METKLKDFKEEYEKLRKEHNLPSFKEMNEDFDIEKIDRESETLLRAVRKVAMEKVVSTIGFIEMLFNPQNSPRMYHKYLQTISSGDRELLEKIYFNLADLILVALDAEMEYDERREADTINKIFKKWSELKPDLKVIFKNLKNPQEFNEKKTKSYFG
jgi:hypothetical protein